MSDHDNVRLRDGRTLAYTEYGNRGGAPIVYCHGVPSSRVEGDLILDNARTAAWGLRIIVPDRPGMGYSDFQPARRIVGWADDVADLAAALGLDSFAVVGSSGGAAYALACAARMPDRVRLVGLIGGAAPADAPGGHNILLRFMFRLARVAPAVLRGLFRLQLRAIRRGGDRGRERMSSWAPEPDRTLLQREEIARGFMACFEEACRNGPRGPASDVALIARPWGFVLADIKVPVRLWHGERDRNVPVASGRYFAAVLPNCRATFYPEDAHLSVPLQHQDEILAALAPSAAA